MRCSHELGAALGLYTETNGDEGERFVTVRKARACVERLGMRAGVLTRRVQRAPVGAAAQLSAAEQKELARTAAAAKVTRAKLSDQAPKKSVLDSVGVVKLNTVKRDLRGVVAVQEEMRAKKEPRLDDK